jgi:hypothetical protein
MRIRKFPWESWPYGCYLLDDSIVLFDRRYRPLVQIPDRGPRVWVPAFTRRDKHPLGIPTKNAKRCSPDKRIENIRAEFWFYSENREVKHPSKDRVAQNVLATLVIEIPELAHEIVARSRRK